MKAVILFSLSCCCLFATTWQQNFYSPLIRHRPHLDVNIRDKSSYVIPFNPNIYSPFNYYRYQKIYESGIKRTDEANEEQFGNSGIESRRLIPPDVALFDRNRNQQQQAENRLLGLKVLGIQYLANLLTSSTTTVYSTTTSTVTVGSVTTCYTSGMFKATTACRRKRSDYDQELFDSFAIQPSNVEVVLPTAIVTSDQDTPAWKKSNEKTSTPELVSSKIDQSIEESREQLNESVVESFHRRNKRQATLTSTVTTVIFYTTTATSTVGTTFAAANALLCLPAGFKLC